MMLAAFSTLSIAAHAQSDSLKIDFLKEYQISGFVDAMTGDGIPPTGVDARFYWPAFFAQWAWIRDAAGADQLDTVLRWYPVAVVAVWAMAGKPN